MSLFPEPLFQDNLPSIFWQLFFCQLLTGRVFITEQHFRRKPPEDSQALTFLQLHHHCTEAAFSPAGRHAGGLFGMVSKSTESSLRCTDGL